LNVDYRALPATGPGVRIVSRLLLIMRLRRKGNVHVIFSRERVGFAKDVTRCVNDHHQSLQRNQPNGQVAAPHSPASSGSATPAGKPGAYADTRMGVSAASTKCWKASSADQNSPEPPLLLTMLSPTGNRLAPPCASRPDRRSGVATSGPCGLQVRQQMADQQVLHQSSRARGHARADPSSS
jgi:hypothetical protein